MSVSDRLRDRLVPDQIEVHLLGNLKSQVQRGVFYVSMFNFANILFIAYRQGAFVTFFPTFWHYLATCVVGFGIIVLGDYLIVLPGEKDYQERQSYLRDPLREDVHEVRTDVKNLHDRLDDLEHIDSDSESESTPPHDHDQ